MKRATRSHFSEAAARSRLPASLTLSQDESSLSMRMVRHSGCSRRQISARFRRVKLFPTRRCPVMTLMSLFPNQSRARLVYRGRYISTSSISVHYDGYSYEYQAFCPSYWTPTKAPGSSRRSHVPQGCASIDHTVPGHARDPVADRARGVPPGDDESRGCAEVLHARAHPHRVVRPDARAISSPRTRDSKEAPFPGQESRSS